MAVYKCTNMLIKIAGATVDVVEGVDIDLTIDGGVEHFYGSREGKHAAGGKKATFTIRRAFMAGSDTDLLWDLFNGEVPFSLSGEIDGLANSQITLSNCIIYRWRPRTGGANDIIGEEASGEATSWSATI